MVMYCLNSLLPGINSQAQCYWYSLLFCVFTGSENFYHLKMFPKPEEERNKSGNNIETTRKYLENPSGSKPPSELFYCKNDLDDQT